MASSNKILVIGGGISGITTALEAAETGYEVILVEKNPTLGGRISGFHQYFPKMCPPTCGLEINYRRLRSNKSIDIYTFSELESISGDSGAYKVVVEKKPTYVNDQCVLCDHCTKVCPSERSNEFNYGMDKTKAIFLPNLMAFPSKYHIDRESCETGCEKCVEACKYNAINLKMEGEKLEFDVSSIVFATGWKPYDARKLKNLGFSKSPDVINNVMMERLASVSGPTKGKILRPSNQQPVQSIAFVQCAGSRDENHLPYCSSICCLGSLKQANYILEQNPDSQVTVYYIDIRTAGKYEDFVATVQNHPNVEMIKGKVANVAMGQTGNPVVEAEDILKQKMVSREYDLVVLATGMEPNLKTQIPLKEIQLDEDGFLNPDFQKPGIYSTGTAKRPVDVNSSIQDATGTSLKAIQNVVAN